MLLESHSLSWPGGTSTGSTIKYVLYRPLENTVTHNQRVSRFHSETLDAYLARQIKEIHSIIRELRNPRIAFVDAIGSHIWIPLHLCVSCTVRVSVHHCSYPHSILQQMLLSVISLYLEYRKAAKCNFVKRGDYRLIQGSREHSVGSKEWTCIERGGWMMEMSITLHDEDETICPTCRTKFENCTVDGWAQW
jgi:hypothetical protein